MGLSRGFVVPLWWYLACVCFIIQTASIAQAQSQQKRSSRITSSRSFGTNVKASASNGINFDCPEEFGYYPHPTDCTQYYVCVFGGALLESCTGGLMYSHELQTCDWPRNVGCEVVDSGATSLTNNGGARSAKQQQQQQSINSQHVPSRIRFGSAFSSPAATTQPPKAPTVPPQYHRQPPQVIQAQVQSLPQHAGTVIGTRGNHAPKPFDTQEDIAKLYADAHETLPPMEEEESDRQQRVYRGQPSTVSQVQRDRDGIIHQASINAIPNHGKIGSYTFGSQFSTKNIDLNLIHNELDIETLMEANDLADVDLEEYSEEKPHKRVKRELSFENKDDSKIIFNTGEILKTEEQTKTLREPRELVYNTGEILKTEADQRTLEKPKIVGYLNSDETLRRDNVGGDYDQLQIGSRPEANMQSESPTQKAVPADLETDENMHDSVMEIVEKILEELRGGTGRTQVDSASSATTTSSKRMDALNSESEAISSGIIPATAADPIMETLNSIVSLLDMDYETNSNDTTAAEARLRGTRQLRQFFNGRARFQIQNVPGTHYRSIDTAPYQQQNGFNFGSYNPYLSPPTTSANYNQLSPGYQVYPQQLQRPQSFGGQKQKISYTAALNPPPPPPPLRIEDDFRPMAANYYRTTTTLRPSTTSARRPNLFNNPELIPYILQSLREYQEQRKKMQQENFQYYHLDNQQDSETDAIRAGPQGSTVSQTPYFQSTKTPTKVTPNSHYAQFSTVGGFYNNKHTSTQQQEDEEDVTDFKSTVKYPSKLVSQYSIIDNYIPTTTESNYFNYNVVGNQKMKAFFSTIKPPAYENPFLASAVPRYTTSAPPTSNIDIVSAPNLTPLHEPTTTKLPKYNNFLKYSESLAFSNNSEPLPESYQVFSKVRTSTIAPKLKITRPTSAVGITNTQQYTRKPALTLQFNVPEFVASLQSSDLANMNPQVVNMIKYFKQINTPQSTRKPIASNPTTSQVKKPADLFEEQIESTTQRIRQRPTVSPTKRPPKGYEDFLKSIPNQAHKFNLHSTQQGKPFSTTSSTSMPDYYDEYEEEEEELGTDTDDDIMPPSQMPPYMPMSETMAPPRPQLMPPAAPTTANPHHVKSNFQTGYIDATTTRGPFGGSQFQQFYQTTTTTNQGSKQHNQIPSFINFPSDIFQEFKQRLPPKPQLGSTVPTLTHNNNNIHWTTAKTSTTTTPRTTPTTTTPSTSTTTQTTTTTRTTTTQRMRYTVRPKPHPHHQRGQSKWHANKGENNPNKEPNTVNNNNPVKSNKTDFSFRKRPAATPASSALGSLQLNVNMHLEDMPDSGQRYKNEDTLDLHIF